ncbi:Chemotaxis protein [Vibrio crassostreae]|nr:Chemotaxis protein [Vibrio crassostreae]
MKRYQQYLSLSLALVAFNSNALQCGAGEVEVDGVCVSSCKILKGTGKNLTWDSYIWGDDPRSYCIGDRSTGAACNMAPTTVSFSVEAGRWTNKFYYTGSTCNFDQINRYSGDTPEPFPWENDINQNGIDDDLEDWDGDGIKNGEDTNPTSNNNIDADENNNDIPDNLEPYYDKISENRPEVIRCSDDSPDCNSHNQALYSLSIHNRELGETIRLMSSNQLSDEYFEHIMQDFSKSVYQQHEFTRRDILLNRSLIQAKKDGGVDNSDIINAGFAAMNDAFEKADGDLSVIKSMIAEVNVDVETNRTIGQSNMQIMGNVNRNVADIKRSLASGGLTSQQANQLKNAAKANANQKLIKELQQVVNDYGYAFDVIVNNQSEIKNGVEVSNMIAASISDDVNEITNQRFNQLSEQINAISGGSSTVDLSGVESSIQALSDKIDGMDGADMSGVENKLTDLIDSVTNTNDFIEPNYDFDGVGFIVTQNQIAEAQNEVLELKQEMVEEFEKFKTLFSIDTSSFNNGTYKEHSLNLNVNHAERSFKSGVFEALLDNASFIAAVIMFLFVVSGIKMLGKD